MDSSLIIELIAEKLQSLPDFHNLQDFIPEFYHFWHDLGCWLQEELVQSKIEQHSCQIFWGKKEKEEKVLYTIRGNGY